MKESIQQMAASLRHSANNIKEYSSGIGFLSEAIINKSFDEITMKESDEIIMGLNVCSKYMTTLEALIKSAKRTAKLINDEVYNVPEALKQDEV